jgi:hypothetical protein
MAGPRTEKRRESRFDWTGFVVLCLIYLGLAFLWNTGWVYPLKLFVVLLHESSHGLMALATGGSIVEIRVYPHQAGLTQTLGGNKFLILSAGYLGSLFFGVSILLVATRTRLSRCATCRRRGRPSPSSAGSCSPASPPCRGWSRNWCSA